MQGYIAWWGLTEAAVRERAVARVYRKGWLSGVAVRERAVAGVYRMAGIDGRGARQMGAKGGCSRWE